MPSSPPEDVLPNGAAAALPWWRAGVLYQIYLRSFADSDGDGSGDLRGVIDRLDHLQWLGVDGIWLSPVTRSPNADWGYDVSDFIAVAEDIGTLDDLDELVAEAGRRSIRVLLDIVPNHTSIEHPWFVDSRSSRTSQHRDWYVWADGAPDGSPPNNWVSSFGGSAWTLDSGSGQYYLHNHLPEQPDLNWWNEDVRRAFDDVFRYWFERGIAGFRIDVCNMIVKDKLLRDNPPANELDSFTEQMFGQRWLYNSGRPELHDVLRHWRRLSDVYENRALIGETPVEDIDVLASYYGQGNDELHLAFNFPFINAPLEAGALGNVVTNVERAVPKPSWPAWTGSNHDMSRLATRWAGGDPRKVRLALVMLLCLRGTPVLYQGDELGLEDTDVPPDRFRDPLGIAYWPAYAGRDAMRTPMPWRNVPGGGFTDPAVEPWLPFGDLGACNVEDQLHDRSSTLHLTRDLIALRRTSEDLSHGAYRPVETGPGSWAFRRGERTVVLLAMGDEDGVVDGAAAHRRGPDDSGEAGDLTGKVRLCTDRTREGDRVEVAIRVSGWGAVVVELDEVR